MAVVPFRCTAVAQIGGPSETVCTSLIGLTWSGPSIYNPPPEARVLALATGLVVGIVASVGTLAWLAYRGRVSHEA